MKRGFRALSPKTRRSSETARVRILSIDHDHRRVALTMRDEHPWLDGVGLPSAGDKVVGHVKMISKLGTHVELEGRIGGLVPIEDGAADSEDAEALAESEWPPGVRVEGRVLSVDHTRRAVLLTDEAATPTE